MNINKLFDTNLDIELTGITDDSRKVKDGYIFVATKGFNVDHYDYIGAAINNGAKVIVADRPINFDIPFFLVNDINNFYPDLCKRFYNLYDNDFSFIGITGTDGKTTSTTIIYNLLEDIFSCSLIGTNGMFINNEKYLTENTTPCTDELCKCLNISKSNNCDHIIMEVSSEALLHDRINGIKYNIIGFTNITEDHLNVHGSIENYVNSKLKLINYLRDDGFIVFNGDDDNLIKINHKNMISFGRNKNNDYIIDNIIEDKNYISFNLVKNNITYKIVSPYLGIYNVYNVTLAFIICNLLGIKENILIEKIKNAKPILGRREYLNFGQKFDIILDYAHTYNGIKSIIDSIDKTKNIIVVTGAAGGREVEKRPKIGKYILDNVNLAIFTMDDPRYESVDEIIDDLVSTSNKDYIRIVDRKNAIFYALEQADNNSVVLILGKGRDNYMAIKDKRNYYSDYDSVSDFFK